jgi:hypothetical protein
MVLCFESDDMHEEIQRCIDECESCRGVCLKAVAHCLERGGRHAEPHHITTLLDCVDMCTITANFLLRGSKMHRRTCEVCAEVCDACAKSCEALDDDVMRRCAAECQRCATSCRAMVAMTARS